MLVTGGLLGGAAFDAVHINAEQAVGVPRGTDHDPILGRFFIEAPNEAPTDLVIDDDAVDENAPAGTLVGTLSADDIDGDTLDYSLVDNAGGLFAVDEATGALTTLAPLHHEAQSSYVIVARATDPDGLAVEQSFTIHVADVNEAPDAADDDVAVNEDATTPNLWNQLLANDSDPDAGATSDASVGTSATLGSVVFDAATQTLRYVADDDSFDLLLPGQTAVDSFTYTVTDQHGLTGTATVEVIVTGIADGIIVNAGNGNDTVNGTGGEDLLNGGNGNDKLFGLAGHDLLNGGNGNDVLDGGDGNDVLLAAMAPTPDRRCGDDWLSGGNGNDTHTGGAGADHFVFGLGGGNDVVTDYEAGVDQLFLTGGLRDYRVRDVNGDGFQDLVLNLAFGGGSVTLLGVDDIGDVDFATPIDLIAGLFASPSEMMSPIMI
jgi:Ca2+-binding RTX toxin-like protein